MNPLPSDDSWERHCTPIAMGSPYRWLEPYGLNAKNNFLCTYFMYTWQFRPLRWSFCVAVVVPVIVVAVCAGGCRAVGGG